MDYSFSNSLSVSLLLLPDSTISCYKCGNFSALPEHDWKIFNITIDLFNYKVCPPKVCFAQRSFERIPFHAFITFTDFRSSQRLLSMENSWIHHFGCHKTLLIQLFCLAFSLTITCSKWPSVISVHRSSINVSVFSRIFAMETFLIYFLITWALVERIDLADESFWMTIHRHSSAGRPFLEPADSWRKALTSISLISFN